MKYIIYFFAILLLLGLNVGLFENLKIFGQVPNLLFLFALYFALEKKTEEFFFVCFLSGVFLDFFSPGFFGAYTFSLLTSGLALHLFVSQFLATELNWKTLTLAIALCWLIFNLLFWLFGLAAFKFNWFYGYQDLKTASLNFFYGLIYNGFLFYPVYLFYNFLKNFVDKLSLRSRGIIK